MIPDHGMAKRGGHCNAGIYLNLSDLKVKVFINYSMSIPNKLFETKKHEGHKTSASSAVRHCFQQLTYWLEWYLVISRESTGRTVDIKVLAKIRI